MGKETISEDPEQKAQAAALRLLARREHSRLELSAKLRQRKFDSGVIERVLDDCERRAWLSDERFADVYARQRIELGYGPLRIQAELQQRGISDQPDCVGAMTEADWRYRAARMREKRFGIIDIRGDWPEKTRQARYLSQRGYTAEQVEAALRLTESDQGQGFSELH